MDTDRHEALTGDDSPGVNGSKETAVNDQGYRFPNSKRTYVAGKLHGDIRVPFREISLAPTKSVKGEIEVNEPVRVYDTSGSWGDPTFHGDVTRGLPALRAKWIRDRGDVEETSGRAATFRDNGFLSEAHAKAAASQKSESKFENRESKFAERQVVR